MILHNLFVWTWQDHLTDAELQDLRRSHRRDRVREMDAGEGRQRLSESHRRRDRLVTDMLEHEPLAFDVDIEYP